MAVAAGVVPRSNYAGGDRGASSVKPLDGAAGHRVLDEWLELLARMSHDLRTPLNAVIGFSDAMQHEIFGPLGNSRYREYARHIRASGDRLLTAAEDALAMTALLASPKALDVRDACLTSLVRQAADAHRPERATAIRIDVCATIQVRVDTTGFVRALRHLLALMTESATGDHVVQVEARAAMGRVELRLSIAAPTTDSTDTGVGNRNGGDLAAVDPVARSGQCSGPGRDELSLWLARTMLELQHCTLHRLPLADGMGFCIELDEAIQQDFFAFASHQD